MNLALLLQFGFSASFHKLARCWPVRKTPHSSPTIATVPEAHCADSIAATCGEIHPVETDALCALHRPLRVVRVLEAGQPRSHVGRMVISGCMADVCAELDRLVAREAALS